jgi:hypothetical protein
LKRILLFLGTNIAVLVVLAIAMQVFGLEGYLNEQGGIDLQSLLIFSAIIGFSGSLDIAGGLQSDCQVDHRRQGNRSAAECGRVMADRPGSGTRAARGYRHA